MKKHIYVVSIIYTFLALLLMFGQFSPENLPHPADRQYITALILSILPGLYLLYIGIRTHAFAVWKKKNKFIRSNEDYLGLRFIYIADETPDDGEKVIMGWVSINNDVQTQDGYILNDDWYESDGTLCKKQPLVWIPMPYAYKN
ncbi:MAG: hypothetical protein QM500_21270 [Methylococcales bacterium]